MIIARYLIKEIFNTSFAVSFVMLLIFLSNQLIRYLKYAASGKIAAGVVAQLIGLEIPYLLVLLLPLGLFLGIILAYGRLYADNEMRVMQAYGFSFRKLFKITTFCGLFVGIIVLVLAIWVNPFLATEKDILFKKSAASENIIDALIPGRFQVDNNDKRVVYVEKIDKQHKGANNIFVAEQKKSPDINDASSWSVLSASKGYQIRDKITKDKFIVASNGYRYEGYPGQNAYKVIEFERYAVRLLSKSINKSHQVQETMSLTQLLKTLYSKDKKSSAELQWRLSLPLTVFFLAILAIPLSHLNPRQSRYANVFPAILIYIVYINMLFVLRDAMEQSSLPWFVGPWMAHIFILISILIAFKVHLRIFSFLSRLKFKKHKIIRAAK
ncbi:LPS export ABC transporter permease LptF [Gammaproteobacteria bacterium]|nr:LPS export ABC transporter permease LptF [Gammaproteobacteria bacterium]